MDYGSEKIFKNIKTGKDVGVYCCILVVDKKHKTTFIYNKSIVNYCNLTNSIFEINCLSNSLKDFIYCFNGIATLRDKIFIHKNKLFDEPCWREIFKVSKNEFNWIIFPYNNSSKIINEDEFKNNNPKTYSFLLQNKKELLKRDNGKKQYETWYAFGRRQGIKIPKLNNVIFISTMTNINFKIHINHPMLFYSGLCIYPKRNLSIDDIKNIILKNRHFILNNSSKRGNDWISISSTVINSITFDL